MIKLSNFANEDLARVEPLLRDWVLIPETGEVDEDRIERILTLIQVEPKNQGDRIYLVAKDGDKIVGMIGYKKPCNYMQSFCKTEHAAEVINFYTTDHFADHKIADSILAEVEARVKKEGGQEIVVNRAPRYEELVDAYFNTRTDYEPVGVAEDFFGYGFDAPVWVKKL